MIEEAATMFPAEPRARMRRWEFLGILAGAAAWPPPARAQQAKLPTIGWLGESTAAGQRQWVAAFMQRLSELGWTEGRNVAIEFRWAEGRNERFSELVDELLQRRADVIVTQGTPSVLAAKRATSNVPIVFPIAGNPVATGLIASLARPGGNVTGLSVQTIDLAGKRLELLREAVPGLRRLAIMANVDNPSVRLELHDVQENAGRLGLEALVAEIRKPDDIASAIDAPKGRADTLYLC